MNRRLLAGAVVVGAALGCYPDTDKLRVSPGSGGSPSGGTGGGAGGMGGTVVGGRGGAGGMGGAVGGAGMGGGMAGMGGAMGGMGGAAQTRPQACTEYARTRAAKFGNCAPFLLAFLYGSEATYAARLELFCSLFDASGVAFPPRPFKPCGDAMMAMSCDDFTDGNFPSVCSFAGTHPDGAGCGFGDQCASGFCNLPMSGVCGACTRAPAAGQPCAFGSICGSGLICNPAMTCVAEQPRGAACSDNMPCRSSSVCRNAVCSAKGTVGAPCTADKDCDVGRGVICNSTRMQCVMANTGPMCVARPDGGFTLCPASGTCKTGAPCLAAAADDAACDEMNGPKCMWPAACTAAKCTIPRYNRTCLPAAGPRGEMGLDSLGSLLREAHRASMDPGVRTLR